MFTLSLKPAPYWIDLPHGVRAQVLPARSTMVSEVNAELFAATDDDDEDTGARTSILAMSKAMARRVIVDWEGVGDEAGNAIAPSAEMIDALLEDPAIFNVFRDSYVLKAIEVAEEGNG
jgi:hypothetical protein